MDLHTDSVRCQQIYLDLGDQVEDLLLRTHDVPAACLFNVLQLLRHGA